MSFKLTFNLPQLDFLLKGIIGNGITLGLTDSTVNYGLLKQLSGNVGLLQGGTGYYGTNVGTNTQIGSTPTNGYSLGITTNATKSGIETEVDSNIKYIIKY